MTAFATIPSTQIDRSSILSGRNTTTPANDSVAERLRQRDDNSYERALQTATPTTILPVAAAGSVPAFAFGIYGVLLTSDGFRGSQLKRSNEINEQRWLVEQPLHTEEFVVSTVELAATDVVVFAAFREDEGTPGTGIDTVWEVRHSSVKGVYVRGQVPQTSDTIPRRILVSAQAFAWKES
jgi:hypothetical protein